MSLENVKRGDTVVIVSHGHRRSDPITVTEAPVTSAGPKYVTAGEGYRSMRFYRDSGAHVTDYTATAFAYADMATWEAKQERDRLMSQAESLMRSASARRLTNWQLIELIELLEPPK